MKSPTYLLRKGKLGSRHITCRETCLRFRSLPCFWPLLILLLLLPWAFLTTDSFLLWWLRWSITGGPQQPDPKLLHNCTATNYSLPIILVIPMISTQLPRLKWNLDRWTELPYHPCPTNPSVKPHLTFFFDRPLSEEKTNTTAFYLRNLLDKPLLSQITHHCFASITISSANLTSKQTRNSYHIDPVHNLVQTQGSNLLFESAFTLFGTGQYRHMFWMEADAYPIRQGWLDAINRESTWGDFWVRGSSMQYNPKFNIAIEPYRSRYQRHINGNSLYALGDPCFDTFRRLTKQVYGYGAFDVAMTLYLMDMKRVKTFQALNFRFQYSRLLANIALWDIDVNQLPKLFPGTYLIHGKAKFVKYPGLNYMQY